ncbi:MAG: hypothetical protein UR93_C0002G0023 [Berkelbacteria bacterium GW2011_GWA2_35_9]|uniref:Uncharacterized protein n=1 Tax=Berkelbacteria bacterium GW2011_GWA2_35_9 TaxID=1618333 RepID=A0A0G0DJZ6_9BACT|nr:MAG: hypothetical protein UR93_C0002G0023 [Berkelbacteria bacterium GW2011_GWA2_35_9]
MTKIDRKHFEKLEEKLRIKSAQKIHRVSGRSVKGIAKIIASKKKQ